MSDLTFPTTSKLSIKSKDGQSETVEDLKTTLKILDEQTQAYQKNKFIYDVLKDCLYDGSIKEPLNKKIRMKILAHETSQSLKLNSNGKTYQLFGLEGNKGPDLTFQEKGILREQFLKKLSSYEQENSSIASNTLSSYDQSHGKTHTNAISHNEDTILIETRSSLTRQIERYSRNILEFSELLNEVQNLRSVKIQKMCEEKLKETKSKNKMMECKAHCINQSVKLDTIGEVDISREGYKTLMDDIKKQQFDLEMDIERLTKLKDMYKSVECKEYDEILKTYLQYMSAIDSLKKINLK